MLKAILFDLGDTLFDFAPMSTRSLFGAAGRSTYDYLQSRGHRLPSFQRYFRLHGWSMVRAYLWSRLTCRDFNTFDVLVRICRQMEVELDEQGLRDLAWRWYTPVTDYCTVADDVIPTLSRLRDRGYKLAIVSNTLIPGFVLDRHLEIHSLLGFFPVRIYSSEVGYRKPHPRIFEMAMQTMGVAPAESLFVGDLVKKDIVGARGVGMRTVLRQRNGNGHSHDLAHHVIRRISDLRQIIPALGAPAQAALPEVDDLICET
jgi:putative hydrolase of the HAD superfamily